MKVAGPVPFVFDAHRRRKQPEPQPLAPPTARSRQHPLTKEPSVQPSERLDKSFAWIHFARKK